MHDIHITNQHSGLAMVQTTNSLYKLVKPESLLAWQRVRLAMVMSRTADEWGPNFAKHASGT